jgi:hypothetical protein
VTSDGGSEDVRVGIRKVNRAFIKLYIIWKSKIISKKSKIRIYNTNVKSVFTQVRHGKSPNKLAKECESGNRCLSYILNLL